MKSITLILVFALSIGWIRMTSAETVAATSASAAPTIWFAPLPDLGTPPLIGSQDFLELFTNPAAWKTAASRVDVFKLYEGWVLNATPAQLQQAVNFLNSRGIKIAVEVGPLTHDVGDGGPHVRTFRADGTPEATDFFAYDANFAGGVHVAAGDLDGDGTAEIITGAGPGGGPHVRAFNADGSSTATSFFPYDVGFTGGVHVAAGDLDGDGTAEIITGAGPGGGPHVRAFNADGSSTATSFFAYEVDFAGGVHVAAGDLDGDGTAEIITGAGPGGGPHVRVFNADGTPLSSFFAYEIGFTGGVHVAAGDLDGDGTAEIITGAGPGGGPHVRAFNVDGTPTSTTFFPYDPGFAGGVHVAARDLDGDGTAEIITGAGPGGGPHVRAFNADGTPTPTTFFAYDSGFAGGVEVAAGDFDGDGISEIITGAGPGGCGVGIEGFAGLPAAIETMTNIANAGGTVSFIAMDEPFFYGSIFSGSTLFGKPVTPCNWSAQKVAQEVNVFMQEMRLIFPGVIIGDIEPIGIAEVAEYTTWLDAVRDETSSELPFFHSDVDFGQLGARWWQPVRVLEDLTRKRGIDYGVIYIGDPHVPSDADWIESAEEVAEIYEAQAGGRPDDVIFQSWYDLPDHVLPEGDSAAFTHLINRYFRARTELSLALRPSADGSLHAVGLLTDEAGVPLVHEAIELALGPLYDEPSALGPSTTLTANTMSDENGAYSLALKLPDSSVYLQAKYEENDSRWPAYAEKTIGPPGTNLARNASASASSSGARNPPDLAVDGRPLTVWNAEAPPTQWIDLDLGTPSTIDQIRLLVEQNPAGETLHQIKGRGRGPGDIFQDIAFFNEITDVGQILEHTLPMPVQDTAVVRVETSLSPSFVAWREIETIRFGADVHTLDAANTRIVTRGSTGVLSWLVDAVDHVISQLFYYRIGSSGREISFSNLRLVSATPENLDGDPGIDVLKLLYRDAAARFTVELRYKTSGRAIGTSESRLVGDMRIRNTSSEILDFHLFQYNGFAIGGTQRNTTTGNTVRIIQTAESPERGTLAAVVQTPTTDYSIPDHYVIESAPDLLDDLNDDRPTVLADVDRDTGVAEWGWQWDLTLGPDPGLVSDATLNHIARVQTMHHIGLTLPMIADIDGDGDVDLDDLGNVLSMRNMAAAAGGDPRDLDEDGRITVLDARRLVLACTRARCATE